MFIDTDPTDFLDDDEPEKPPCPDECIIEDLEINLRMKFKNHIVGTLCQDTNGVNIKFGDHFFDSKFKAVDVGDISLSDLQFSEPVNPILYPNNESELEYLFDSQAYELIDDMDEITNFKDDLVSLNDLSGLEQFGINFKKKGRKYAPCK